MSTPADVIVDRSVLGKTWVARAHDPDDAARIARELMAPEIVGQVMSGRGVSFDGLEAFLDTALRRHLPDPSTLTDLDKGAERLADAIAREDVIGIFGDYDVDGGTGTAILYRYLKAVGGKPETYIPDRRREGYGPSAAAFQSLIDKGASVIVTIDCGTTALGPIRHAGDEGASVIIVDHHLPGDQWPNAHAFINPKRYDDESGLDYLSAAGVAFMLVVGLNRALRDRGHFTDGRKEPDLMSFLDLAALGTVCDVVPLQGLNRSLVSQGLKVLGQRRNDGLSALADVARMSGEVTPYDLGFLLGPRLNAGSRIGPSDLALRLLTSESRDEALTMARELDALNQQRRDTERKVLDEAMLAAKALVDRGAKVLVVAGEGWHEGVVGIVAGRVKDRFSLPAIVLSIKEDGLATGSGRSLHGVDLGSAVIKAVDRDVLVKGGGHGMAAGMTVQADRIQEFATFLEHELADQIVEAQKHLALKVDGHIGLGSLTTETFDALAQAGPFGEGNPEPLIIVPRANVVSVSIVGEDHVRCVLGDAAGHRIKGIAFRAANTPLGAALLGRGGEPVQLAGRLKLDTWNGRRQVQLQIEDAAPA